MALFDEASPICRGKNLSWETVLLFFNNMPKEAMPKAKFNAYVESRINAWTQTHSQIARQLAFYYEDNGICYPRFTQKTNLQDLFAYMQNWATRYFIPNPYAPSLKGYTPTCIYSFIIKSIKEGQTDFDEILDSIFQVKLSSHDKVNVYLSYFTGLIIDNNHHVSINEKVGYVESDLHPEKDFATDAKKYFDYFTIPKEKSFDIKQLYTKGKPLQQIFYGAPGTGKSHNIKDNENVKAADKKNLVFRTTFHPDSDYSTFVGCYKPSMSKAIEKSSQPILDYDSLVDKFKEYLNVPNVNITKACTLFGYDYHDSIIRIQEHGRKVMDLVNDAYKSNTSYDSVVRGGMACYEQNPIKDNGSKITYQFVAQAFTNAYVEAWNTEEEVYLVIEEINRGNCAQIFGDLFQLLDRKNGVSEYPVEADADLQNYLNKALADTTRTDIPDEVKSGKKLMLPSNLYIWATMNTSDQSLFPIDSAFKRRWEWKYNKIKEGRDENGNKLDWKVDVKIDEEGNLLSWWNFIQKINEIIASMTSSADKQLGYFFCCAKDGVIGEEMFVSKVIFYLWNDVFKDYGFEDTSLFRYTDNDGKEKDLTFPDFYDEDGEKVNTERLTDFVKKVMNWKKTSEENN